MRWNKSSTSSHGKNRIINAEFELCQRYMTEEERNAMRVYRNTDGTWSLMPNWFKSYENVQRRAVATNYATFEDIPEPIQEKLGVLLLKESGSEWLTGVGKRVDDGVFWLEDG